MKLSSRAVVKEVVPDSIGQEAGIEPGDVIIGINGEQIFDILEYKFLTSEEELEIEVQKANGEIEVIEVYNEEYEDLGLIFENPLIDKAKSCSNKCIFCFIDQLPKNMRRTVYFKDDDSRLSFLQGNYVTLTNMSDEDIDRIIRFRLSPINISVHTTNPDLRVMMLGNPTAGTLLERMRKLAEANIQMNCQIVLCRNINDGVELDRSLEDLTGMFPHVNSISVVPVGLTRHRDKLFELEKFDGQSADEVIFQLNDWQKRSIKKYGSRIVFLADEFYLLAKKTIPPYEEYEGFPQIENGVGLIASMKEEFNDEISNVVNFEYGQVRQVSIATGTAAKDFIESLTQTLERRFKGLKVNVYPIENEFFGKNVNVAGLVTGGDIIKQLADKVLGTELFIPVSMLRSDRDLFLDDTRIEDVEQKLKIKLSVIENDGYDFIHKILGHN